MEIDFELLLYIIFVAIAILSRLLKKRKSNSPAPPRQTEQTEEPKPVSFEDLLREFTQKEEPARPEPVPEPEPVVREYEFNDPIPDDEEINEIYEKSIKAASKTADQPEQKSPMFGHFAEYDAEEEINPIAEDIKEMLANTDTAAKAVILSEIISRKY